jgi:eukaryotic-like serine/threonine-protein kinase
VLSSGHLLDNRYRLDERIASGGMGDVWRGTDVVLGRTIAVKVLRPAMMTDPEFAARFYGEARMMAAFRHPGVVEVYDYASAGDDDDHSAYLVMAYVEGEPLSTRLKEAGRLTVGETMSIVAQTADALHAAHQNGTIHRDVKPGNLIVKPNGAVVLVDFGVARSNAVTSMTGVNSIVGTALYMAPEQVAKGRVTPATDIYALGAVAYHCLAGRPPFDGDNALQVALRHLEDEPDPLPDDIPPAARAVVARAMAKNPADRFESAADLAQAALAASAPMDWTARTSAPAAATAMAATTPLSPAPAYAATPIRTAPAPAVLPPPMPPGRRRKPRGQLIVLLTVIGLMLLAAGLAIALALSGGGPDDPGLGGTPAEQPSAGVSDSAATGGQPVPAESAPTTRAPKPNGATVRPTTNRPRTSAPPSTATTTRPTAHPTTTPPVTEPTTTPTTTQPTPTDTVTTGAGSGSGGGQQ